MKTLGIVGGIGPESTIEYYRFILEGCRQRVTDGRAPHIIIDSIDVNRAIAMLDTNDLAGVAAYLGESVDRLARAGADVAVMAANTAHIVFDEVQRRSPIPLIRIVEAACDDAKRLGLKRLALLGTGFTMRARFYPDFFAREGLELVTPSDAEKASIHDKYINELLENRFLPETRDAMLAIIGRMRQDEGIDGVILAGTELPLLLRGTELAGLPFLDTTMIHVERAVTEVLAWRPPSSRSMLPS
jgi:aspartate racemase